MSLESIPPVGGGITLIVFSTVLIILTVIFVSLRFWARRILKKKLEINDYLILIGALLAVTNATLSILAVVYGGVGYHQLQVIRLYPELAKITLALALVWTVANTFVKLSIMHFYMVIFHISVPFRRVSYAVICLIIGYCVTNIVLNLIDCKPIAYNWDKTIPGGSCTTVRSPYLSSAIINMSIDVIIFSLPLPMLWGLRMNTQKKIYLMVVFGLGFLICIISAVRIHVIATMNLLDFSFSVVPDGVYSVIEPCAGVINACLPLLPPIGAKVSQSKLFGSLRSYFTRNTQSSSLGEVSARMTFGGGAPKKKRDFMIMDEESNASANESSSDQYPLTNISVQRSESNFKADQRW